MNYYTPYSNKDDGASATWPDFLYPNTSVPQSTYPEMPDPVLGGYPSTAGSYNPYFNTANDAAFSLAPTTEMGAFANPPIQADFTNQNAWSMPGPSHLDVNPAVSQPLLVGDQYYTGVDPLAAFSVANACPMPGPSHLGVNPAVSQPLLVGDQYYTGVDPLAAFSVATTSDLGVSPTPTTSMSQDENEWAWPYSLLSTPCTTPGLSPEHGGEAGGVAPGQGANILEFTPSPAGWDTSGISWPIPAAPGDVASNVTTTFASAVALGKRRCEVDDDVTHTEMPPPKRARGGETAKGIQKAARSGARTPRKPAARIPKQRINSKPKEAGCGAERLATPSSQGIYHPSLPGPSFQQDWSVDAADGKPTRVEGSVDEEGVHHVDSTVQQEARRLITIPKLRLDHRTLLLASEADFARGAVEAIKCRLCPKAKHKNFDAFKRHCNSEERHPLKIEYCLHCGDFFARSDALKRHYREPPPSCPKATETECKEKTRVTEEMHDNFVVEMLVALLVGESFEGNFSQIVKERFPGSCKKKRTGWSK